MRTGNCKIYSLGARLFPFKSDCSSGAYLQLPKWIWTRRDGKAGGRLIAFYLRPDRNPLRDAYWFIIGSAHELKPIINSVSSIRRIGFFCQRSRHAAPPKPDSGLMDPDRAGSGLEIVENAGDYNAWFNKDRPSNVTNRFVDPPFRKRCIFDVVDSTFGPLNVLRSRHALIIGFGMSQAVNGLGNGASNH